MSPGIFGQRWPSTGSVDGGGVIALNARFQFAIEFALLVLLNRELPGMPDCQSSPACSVIYQCIFFLYNHVPISKRPLCKEKIMLLTVDTGDCDVHVICVKCSNCSSCSADNDDITLKFVCVCSSVPVFFHSSIISVPLSSFVR